MASARTTSQQGVFKSRVTAGEILIGSFLKSPVISTVEIFADAGFDFLVIDQEHAPIDRATADTMIFAAKALGLGALVRIPIITNQYIQSSLDMGADGVLAPHVSSAALARAVVDAGRFSRQRGYSGAVRAAGYGSRKMAEIVASCDQAVLSVAQIEDVASLDCLEAIAACDGIDALFIGRGDLAVSLRAHGRADEDVWRVAGTIAQAAISAGKIVAGFAQDCDAARRLMDMGATLIVLGADQAFLRRGAGQAMSGLCQMLGKT